MSKNDVDNNSIILERYHALIESTNSMVWSVNIDDFGLVTFNTHMKDYYKKTLNIDLVEGLRPDQMLPKQELIDYWLNNYKRVINEGPFTIEYTMISSPKTLLISFYPMKINNKLIGISVFTQDITEFKNAITKANNESLKYKLLFDNVHDYVCILDSTTHKFLHFNDNCKQTIKNHMGVELKIGDDFNSILRESTSSQWDEIFKNLSKDTSYKTELELYPNVYLNLELKLLRLTNEDEIIYIIGQDISSVLVYEKKLEQSNLRLTKLLQQSINAISKISEFKDPYTSNHQLKVQKLSVLIAEKMNLNEDIIKNLGVGALIFDIGKLYVASDILNKPSSLSELEFKLIKSHVESSFLIANEIDFSPIVKQMILQHHERLDGSGYPNHLKENEIILESRILGVADVVVAMNSYRPYRESLGIESSINELLQNKGTKYDSAVVDACIFVLNENPSLF